MPNTATSILRSISAAIKALQPASSVTIDDVFRVRIGGDEHTTGRSYVLECSLPVRRLPSRTCNEWQVQVSIEAHYELTPVDQETGECPAYIRIVDDSEAILAALYDWVALQDGVTIQPQPGVISLGESELIATRALTATYTRA